MKLLVYCLTHRKKIEKFRLIVVEYHFESIGQIKHTVSYFYSFYEKIYFFWLMLFNLSIFSNFLQLRSIDEELKEVNWQPVIISHPQQQDG